MSDKDSSQKERKPLNEGLIINRRDSDRHNQVQRGDYGHREKQTERGTSSTGPKKNDKAKE